MTGCLSGEERAFKKARHYGIKLVFSVLRNFTTISSWETVQCWDKFLIDSI